MAEHDLKILLVEDDPMIQFVFGRQLGRLGYKLAAIADNGLAAVQKVVEDPYQLVFMDVRLPGIDGLSATARIRRKEAGNGVHTPIIGLTAFGERQLCIDAGMDDFLQKPVPIEELEEIIRQWGAGAVFIPTIAKETRSESILPDKFAETDEKFKAIQERISNLRKRHKLD